MIYIKHYIPIIAQYLYNIKGLKDIAYKLLFMQDNVLDYTTKETKAILTKLTIIIIT